MDDLRTQARQCREHTFADAVDDAVQEPAPLAVVDEGGVRKQVREPLLVPRDRSPGGRMEEPAQGDGHTGHGLADALDGRAVEPGRVGVTARHAWDEPDEVRTGRALDQLDRSSRQ